MKGLLSSSQDTEKGVEKQVRKIEPQLFFHKRNTNYITFPINADIVFTSSYISPAPPESPLVRDVTIAPGWVECLHNSCTLDLHA